MASSKSASVKRLGLLAVGHEEEPHGVLHLAGDGDLALELVGHQLAEALELAAGELLVVADADEPVEERQRELPLRVPRDVGERRDDVRRVGHRGPVELLDEAVAQEPGRGDVGEDHQVAVDALTVLEDGRLLRPVLLVVVDVLAVLDLDAGLLREVLQRGGALVAVLDDVDVVRPARPEDLLLGRRQVGAGERGRRLGGAGRARRGAARGALGAAGGQRHRGADAGASAQHGAARQDRSGGSHGVLPRSGASTTHASRPPARGAGPGARTLSPACAGT